ncbi:MAG TPA: hypothetical protein PLN48_03720 [Lachnospiraceae bacterium]|nr:hypothetical protein [Lachnospiraceae bacterium]
MEFKKAEKKEVITDAEVKSRMNAWPDCYYRERDARVRRQLLDEASRENLTPEENKMREVLWNKRYKNAGPGSPMTDLYLKTWLDFRFISENLGGLFGNKSNRKKALEALKCLGGEELESFGSAGDNILYQEIYHLGMLYISLCQEDRNYKSLVFGLGSISDDRLISKIAAEFRSVAIKVPKETGLTKECGLWTRALTAAFSDAYPDSRTFLEE